MVSAQGWRSLLLDLPGSLVFASLSWPRFLVSSAYVLEQCFLNFADSGTSRGYKHKAPWFRILFQAVRGLSEARLHTPRVRNPYTPCVPLPTRTSGICSPWAISCLFIYLFIYLRLSLFVKSIWGGFQRSIPAVKELPSRKSETKGSRNQGQGGWQCGWGGATGAAASELPRWLEFPGSQERRQGQVPDTHHSEGSCLPVSQWTQSLFQHESIK